MLTGKKCAKGKQFNAVLPYFEINANFNENKI